MRGVWMWAAADAVALCGATQAQTVPVVDPSYLPVNLVQTRVDACGVALGADPVWSVTLIRETGANGTPQRGTEFEVTRAFWRSVQGDGARFVVNPFFSVDVSCSPTTLSEAGALDGQAFFADRMHSFSKERGLKPKRLRTFTVNGLGTVYALQDVSRLKRGDAARIGASLDITSYFAIHRSQLVTIRVTVHRALPDLFARTVRKGKEVAFETEEAGV